MKIRYLLCTFFLPFLLLCCGIKKKDYHADIEQLKSLPYVSWTEDGVDESLSGVTEYNADKAYPGYNLLLNKENHAYLLDMNGNIVHTWVLPKLAMWEYGVIKENGNLVAECLDQKVVEITWDSRVVWEKAMVAHHDIEILPDGSYLIPDKIVIDYKSRNINFDRIVRVSETGETIEYWSTWDNLKTLQTYHNPTALDEEPDEIQKTKFRGQKFDYYHLNTIKLLPFTWRGFFDKRFQKGNWLICLRNVNLILILDKDTKQIVWHWGPGEVEWPHMPVMLENGDILIFDNGVGRRYTRVIIVNPLTKKITWEYKANPPQLFYSGLCGSAQQFPNGNILITNADEGHVFEVTLDKEIVWEFFHFEIEGNRRKSMYRMIRYPEKMINTLLTKYGGKVVTKEDMDHIPKTTEVKPQQNKYNSTLKNGGFEQGEGNTPADWKSCAYTPGVTNFTLDFKASKSGKASVKIDSQKDNAAELYQKIAVNPGTDYLFSGWVKTANIPVNPENSKSGAKLAVSLGSGTRISQCLSGDNDWTKLSVPFHSGTSDKIIVRLRLGFDGILIPGAAWFDDLTLESAQHSLSSNSK